MEEGSGTAASGDAPPWFPIGLVLMPERVWAALGEGCPPRGVACTGGTRNLPPTRPGGRKKRTKPGANGRLR